MSLKIKLLQKRLVYIIYSIIMLVISYIFNRLMQMLMFMLFFDTIQNCFAKRFHADTLINEPTRAVLYCKIITIIIQLIYLYYCNRLNISVYSNLTIIFIVAFGNALLEHYCETIVIRKANLGDIDILKQLCDRAGITYEARKRLEMKYVEHKTIKEIASIECVSEDTIKKSLMRSRKKIGI